jgi:hypothetical protein
MWGMSLIGAIRKISYLYLEGIEKIILRRKSVEKFVKKGGKYEMNQTPEKSEAQTTKIITQIAELSRLLGMIPSDDTIKLHEPLTQNKMDLSDWLRAARDSFLKLSVLISKELDIQLQ